MRCESTSHGSMSFGLTGSIDRSSCELLRSGIDAGFTAWFALAEGLQPFELKGPKQVVKEPWPKAVMSLTVFYID